MKTVYICHPLTASTLEGIEANRKRAAVWAAWALTVEGVSPVCSWITLTGVLPETPENRRLGLEADKAQVALCSEIWLCGGRISNGMREEMSVAKRIVDLTHLGEWPPGYEPKIADTDPAPKDEASANLVWDGSIGATAKCACGVTTEIQDLYFDSLIECMVCHRVWRPLPKIACAQLAEKEAADFLDRYYGGKR